MLMTFKEYAAKDINEIFFNCNEFAEVHSINGQEISIIIDEHKLNEQNNKFNPLNEFSEKMILFYVSKDNLEFSPKINTNLMFDGELYQVFDVIEDNGIFAVTIMSNNGR